MVSVESVLRVVLGRLEDLSRSKSGLVPLDFETLPDTPVENGSNVER